MDNATRIERALNKAIAVGLGEPCPARLLAAVRYAVFPGGARIRPKLCLAVARACGDENLRCAAAAAAAVELLHCASLVHDDLPCFDNATLRRGRPAVHLAFGEPMAVLTGDALIVMAFESVARVRELPARHLQGLLLVLARASGMPNGIVAGQAWEGEPNIPLVAYQRAKTGALFAAATSLGAIAAGADGAAWHALGEKIGAAYQIADDIRDVSDSTENLGKDVGRDAVLGRPNAVHEMGIDASIARLQDLMAGALAQIPPCIGAADLRSHIRSEASRLLPAKLARPMRVVA
ncbi:MAG TPA: polyprenyl synthetase family protein [Steroidobacteraceae bacterium]|nr:polyprenyl synthetase family protein [Steroidobacteraceae bacterium]